MAERVRIRFPKPRKGDPRHIRRVSRLQDNIVASVRNFIPFTHACALHGVNLTTAQQWLRLGENYYRAMDDEAENPNHEMHHRFTLNLKRARAEVQEEIIERSFRGNRLNAGWVRDMTYLSRTDPLNWSQQNRSEAIKENESSGDQYEPDESFL